MGNDEKELEEGIVGNEEEFREIGNKNVMDIKRRIFKDYSIGRKVFRRKGKGKANARKMLGLCIIKKSFLLHEN